MKAIALILIGIAVLVSIAALSVGIYFIASEAEEETS